MINSQTFQGQSIPDATRNEKPHNTEAVTMLKRFFLALLLLAPIQAHAYGTISFSLSQNLDQFGKPLAGCKFYTYQAGTVATPQNAYSDTGLTTPLPNPQTCDGAGRLPQFFLADGNIKVALTTSAGSPVVSADNILVIGPSSGGGGGGTVDATTVLQTGDLKPRYGTGAHTGFVRANGRTIGNGSSGASERANADTQALFIFLYNSDPNLTTSSARTGNALNDFNANFTITLPDWRGRALAFLDDMGNTAAGKLTNSATGCGVSAIVLGAACGQESVTLTLAQIPAHNHGISDPGHVHNYASNGTPNVSGAGITVSGPGNGNTGVGFTGITILNNGGGGAHPTVMPLRLATIYIKL